MVLNWIGYESMRLVEFFLFFGLILWVGVVVLMYFIDENIRIGIGWVFCYFFFFVDLECKIGLLVYIYGVFGLMDN